MKNPYLHRFWIEFKHIRDTPSEALMGCGVTAYDEADALKIVQTLIFRERAAADVRSLIKDVDVASLDQNHVLPNIGDVTLRGIWFPRGYEIADMDRLK